MKWLSKLLTMVILDPRRLDLSAALLAIPYVTVLYYTVNHHQLYNGSDRVKIMPGFVQTWNDYNIVLRSAWFWKTLPTEFMLLFEQDAFFCKHPTFHINFFIREMIQYKYPIMGAPWKDKMWWCRLKGRCVGNSGLSLWNVRMIIPLLPNESKSAYKLDSSLHRRAVNAKLLLPPNEIAEKFSFETTRGKRWFVPFGCHKRVCCDAHAYVLRT